MSGATLVSIHFHYILKEGIQGILPCFLTAHAPWATRTHGNYFFKLMGWKALMAHLVVYMPSSNYNNWSIWSGDQLTPTSGKTMNNPSNKSPQWWYNLQLFILYHSGWSSIHQKLKLHGKWCWKVVVRHPWLKFNPFARKTSFAKREVKEEELSSRNHIWYGRLADKAILSLYTLKY